MLKLRIRFTSLTVFVHTRPTFIVIVVSLGDPEFKLRMGHQIRFPHL